MDRYKNGKIYKIVDVGFNKCYYGSTTEPLSKRMERHRKDYKEYLQNGKNYTRSLGIFCEYGVENCKILLVEDFPCETKEQLLRREGEYIRNNECVNKQIAGRTSKEYYQDNNDTLRQKSNIYYKENTKACNERSKQYYESHRDETIEYKKQWYKQNKERHHQKNKEYRQSHKEEIALKNKERYEQNKEQYSKQRKERYERDREQILEEQKEKVSCLCGARVRKQHLRRHEKTQKHQNYLEHLKDTEQPDDEDKTQN